jgi:hypothetical protein
MDAIRPPNDLPAAHTGPASEWAAALAAASSMTARQVAIARGGRSGEFPTGLAVGEVETQGGDAVVVQRVGEPGHEGVLHPGAGPVREDQRGERVLGPGVETGDLEIADADGYGGLG